MIVIGHSRLSARRDNFAVFELHLMFQHVRHELIYLLRSEKLIKDNVLCPPHGRFFQQLDAPARVEGDWQAFLYRGMADTMRSAGWLRCGRLGGGRWLRSGGPLSGTARWLRCGRLR